MGFPGKLRVGIGFSALALAFLAGCSSGRSLDDPDVQDALTLIDPTGIETHMQVLASDEMQGRGTGAHGYLSAAEYVASQFESAGLSRLSTLDGWFQQVPLASTDAVQDLCSLRVAGSGSKVALAYGEDFVMAGDFLREEVGLTAEVVYVGFGVHAPELDYDDYAGIDVEGKFVLLFSGAPANFPNDQRAYHSSLERKQRLAAERGAVGIVGMLLPKDRERMPWERIVRQAAMNSMRWVEADGTPHGVQPSLYLNALLDVSGVERLFASSDRTVASVVESAESGRVDSFLLPNTLEVRGVSHRGALESPNVVGLLEGSDPALSSEYVAISAHLDHLGTGDPVEGDPIYNGAYDNASGAAILLELAEAFGAMSEPPGRSLIFLAVTGEEKGLLGSDYFVHAGVVAPESIVANVNLDMVLMQHRLVDLIAFGAEHSNLIEPLERATEFFDLRVTPDPMPEEVIFIRSDQYSFVRQGVPALFLISGFDTGDDRDGPALAREWMRTTYHHPSDDMDQTFDYEAGALFAKTNFLVSWIIADQRERPAWNEGDFFGERFGND